MWAQALSPPVDEREAMRQEMQELWKKIKELDQRLRIADRNRELKADDDTAKAKAAAIVVADTTGFTIKSEAGNFLLKIGADIQVDNRTFTCGGSKSLTD